MNLKTYQRAGIERGRDQGQCYFYKMGLGKTAIALHLIPAEPSLNVVAAPNSAQDTWLDEVKRWRPDVLVYTTMMLPAKKRLMRRDTALHAARTHPVILLINYTQALETWRILKGLNERLWAVIADESSYIKNGRAERSKAMHGLRSIAERGYCLSGTPLLQGPLDLYSQIRFAEPVALKESFWAFRGRYATMGGFEKKQVVGYRNIESHLMPRIRPYAQSLCAEDVGVELPDKINVKRYIELSDKEKKNYKQIKKDAILELSAGEIIPISNALAKLQKLQQAAGGFFYLEDHKAVEIGRSKRNAVVDLITRGDLYGQPTIVWAVYRHELERITAELKDKVQVASHILDGSPQQAMARFVDGKADVLIGNPASLGYGANLQRATAAVFLSNSFKYGDREQAEARCYRIGQENKVTIVDVIAKGTVDEKVLKVLSKKAEWAEIIEEEFKVRTKGGDVE